MRSRMLVLALVCSALLALGRLGGSVTPEVPLRTARIGTPEVAAAKVGSAVWFCPAGGVPGVETSHEVVIANPTGQVVSGSWTAVGDQAGAATKFDVPASGVLVLSEGAANAGAVVELDRVGPVVSHRMVAGGTSDDAVCSTSTSGHWYFPAVASDVAGGKVASLSIMNPLLTDASVDVRVSSDDGVRTPAKLAGLVVPARSVRSIPLGDIVQVRSQAALTVQTRSGSVVSELVQYTTAGDVKGLALVPGQSTLSDRGAFAAGSAASGASERLVVFNPSAQESTVVVAVVPDGATEQTLPEPFQLTVAPFRYVEVDLSGEQRVPKGAHWITFQVGGGAGVVVSRVLGAVGGSNPWGVSSGLSVTAPISVGSDRLVLPWADRSSSATSRLHLVNPSPSSIAVVTVRSWGNGAAGTTSKVEVAPLASSVVDLGATGDVPRVLTLESTSPVIAERVVVAGNQGDLGVVAAVPVAGHYKPLETVGALLRGGR